ncbi:14379_t:CDS:1, partial [Acaulospora colombiana]
VVKELRRERRGKVVELQGVRGSWMKPTNTLSVCNTPELITGLTGSESSPFKRLAIKSRESGMDRGELDEPEEEDSRDSREARSAENEFSGIGLERRHTGLSSSREVDGP